MTSDLWIRILLAAAALAVLVLAPAVSASDDGEDPTTSSAELEQPGSEERASRRSPARNVRRDAQRAVRLSAPIDPDTLVPPLRGAEGADADEADADLADGDDGRTGEDDGAPAGTPEGPPGASVAADLGDERNGTYDDGRRHDDERIPTDEQVLGELDVEVVSDDAVRDALRTLGANGPGGLTAGAANSGGPNSGGTPGSHGPGNMKGGPGCWIQCITSGVAYARGVNARLVVKTDTPAVITLSVYDASPNSYHVSSEFGQLTTSYAVDLTDLQPGTTYQVLAAAEDSEGHTSYATGSFTTLRRQAEVTFHLNWQVTTTPYDARFHYHYRVANTWRDGLTVGYWPNPQPPVNLPLPVTVKDAPRYLDVAAQVVAEDEVNSGFGQGGCPVEGGAPPPFGPFDGSVGLWGTSLNAGPDGCHPVAWSTAHRCDGGFDLDARPADATSWTEHVLKVAVTTSNGCSNQPLSFTVPATVEVSYVP